MPFLEALETRKGADFMAMPRALGLALWVELPARQCACLSTMACNVIVEEG